MRDEFNTEKKYLDMFIQHLPPEAAVLDICCGSGYPIASYLIDNGLQVTGIDASEKLRVLPGTWLGGFVACFVASHQFLQSMVYPSAFIKTRLSRNVG